MVQDYALHFNNFDNYWMVYFPIYFWFHRTPTIEENFEKKLTKKVKKTLPFMWFQLDSQTVFWQDLATRMMHYLINKIIKTCGTYAYAICLSVLVFAFQNKNKEATSFLFLKYELTETSLCIQPTEFCKTICSKG